jgi:osmotically-inducible protein OsmY
MMSRSFSPLAALALAAALAGSLSACVPLVVGGAAVSAMVAVDRRTSGAQLVDEGIVLRDAFGAAAHFNITSYNRQVLLTGEVPDEAAKQRAEQIVSRVENVRTIVNELAIGGTSTIVQRSSDVLITGKVKASLVDAKDLYAGAFKVVTESSTVYLMGRVTQREADRATAIARQVSGVQRVVRIFELIGNDELRRIQTNAPTAPASSRP